MRAALHLAERGRGRTSPNPMVGAVIVKNGEVVGSGYHKKAGLPHAEIYAIHKAGENSRGATLYVTLEPCNHFGRTPPCTEAIIESGIKRAVIATTDPNPLNNGRGLRRLRRAGIAIALGPLKDEAERLNEAFFKYITTGLPFVTVKVAESLDGKISTKTGDSKWISGIASRRYAHKLRSENDAVLVGQNTYLMDKPALTNRLYKPLIDKQPKKIILRSASKGRIDLKQLMKGLGREGVTSVLIEGGGETIASALEAGLVDKMVFILAPKIIGGRNAKTPVEGNGIKMVKDAVRLKGVEVTKIDSDICISGYVK